MSDPTNTQESIHDTLNEAVPPVKRGRGRPKGSKNKPKPEGFVKAVKTPNVEKAAITIKPAIIKLPTVVDDTDIVETPVDSVDNE